MELQRLVHGGQVNLDMEDHQEQEYVKPRLRFKAFSGEGQKLGRWKKLESLFCALYSYSVSFMWLKISDYFVMVPLVTSGLFFFQSYSLTPEIVSTPSSPEEEEKSILNAPVLIDDSMPATKIQIRLADGSRLIQRFNQTHR